VLYITGVTQMGSSSEVITELKELFSPAVLRDAFRFKLGSTKRLEEKWSWSLCDTTKTT
jgi:hypothetical protein